jgi:enoyl-CoA hydratase
MLNIERIGDIEVFTINRPQAGNSINSDLTSALIENLERLHRDNNLHALIITGSGEKFFCTGGDIKEYREIKNPEALNYHFDRTRKAMDLIETLKCPVISAINGYALGGGAELILCTDYRIAEEHSEIGWPQSQLGIIPAWNGIDRLVRDCGPRIASNLLMTGKRISAEAAEKFRIVDIVVKTNSSMEFALEYAVTLKKSAPKALKATKEIIAATGKYSYDEVRQQQHAIFPDLWFSKDHKEAEAAFAEKRPPIFKNK